MDLKPFAVMVNPVMESVMVCVIEMGSVKKSTNAIMNETLTSAVRSLTQGGKDRPHTLHYRSSSCG